MGAQNWTASKVAEKGDADYYKKPLQLSHRAIIQAIDKYCNPAIYELKFCYKLENYLLLSYFSSMFIKHSSNHRYSTRHSNNFQLRLNILKGAGYWLITFFVLFIFARSTEMLIQGSISGSLNTSKMCIFQGNHLVLIVHVFNCTYLDLKHVQVLRLSLI